MSDRAGWLLGPSSATAAAGTLAAESTGSHCNGTVLISDRRAWAVELGADEIHGLILLTDSSEAHWLSFGANGLRWSSLCAPTSSSPHWSSLGASMSNSPGSSSALDQPPTVLGAPPAAPFEKLL